MSSTLLILISLQQQINTPRQQPQQPPQQQQQQQPPPTINRNPQAVSDNEPKQNVNKYTLSQPIGGRMMNPNNMNPQQRQMAFQQMQQQFRSPMVNQTQQPNTTNQQQGQPTVVPAAAPVAATAATGQNQAMNSLRPVVSDILTRMGHS